MLLYRRSKVRLGILLKDVMCDVCVDSGLSRGFTLNMKTNLKELIDLPLTEWDLLQRVGRVARDRYRGIYLLLQPKSFRDRTCFVKKNSPPGICTEFVGKWIMKVLAGGGNPYTEPYPWKRSFKHIQYCAWVLHSLGVLKGNPYKDNLVSNWKFDRKLLIIMVRLQLSPRSALMFINSHFTNPNVIEDISILVAMLEVQPFLDSFYRVWKRSDMGYCEKVEKHTPARCFLFTRNGRFGNSTVHRLVGLYRYALQNNQWYDSVQGEWKVQVEDFALSRTNLTEVTAMISSLRNKSPGIKSQCAQGDMFFTPSKWVGIGATKRENFEAVVGRGFAVQLASGKKMELLESGTARMVESGLSVRIKEAELNLLKSTIQNVKGDDKNLFFVFLRAETKHGGYTEVSDVLPLCDRVGRGILSLVHNVKRRKVKRKLVPSAHSFTFQGEEGFCFDYKKYESIKSGKAWNLKVE